MLRSEKRWDEALVLIRPPAHCREGVLAYLARRLGAGHLAYRIDLLMRVVAREMRNSKSPYRNELELVDEIASLLDPTRRASWLQQLRLELQGQEELRTGLAGAVTSLKP